MNKYLILTLWFCLCAFSASATKLKGHVYDKRTGEALVGATVVLEKTKKVAVTGLDGVFEMKDVPKGRFTLRVSYLNYSSVSIELDLLDEDNPHVKVYLEETTSTLTELRLVSQKDGSTEREARKIEQQAVQVMNAVSGRAIEISPDLTVANVIQRVSGVSVERNSNGDGQYAILRGMDKRYNYTLVNGVKIPSPDNRYRYVPLDLFPADLMERLEVYKTLTPNLEGDAIGGAVNMVMKNAPARLTLNANIAGGFNQLFADRNFKSFGSSSVNFLSPYELGGRTYAATPTDFTRGTLDYSSKTPPPNVVGSLSVGQRFFDGKLGMILAGSYQDTYRGSNSTFYNTAVVGTDHYSTITGKSEREYSEQQKRLGLHGKVDYAANPRNTFSLYTLYVNLDNLQTRDAVSNTYSTGFDAAAGNAELSYATRSRLTRQRIYNNTLHGDHLLFGDRLKVGWSAVYSSAENQVPDNTTITLSGVRKNFAESKTVVDQAVHRWERNTDEDKAGYLDLTYSIPAGKNTVDLSAGGLYRDKQRSGFFNNYTLYPVNPAAKYGVDFKQYTDVAWSVQNPTGAVNNPLTYDASEKIAAGYAMVKFQLQQLQVITGARVEHTDQGYALLFPAGEQRPSGNQVYTDLLPSLTLKYQFRPTQQLHGSYYRSLNRPGFYEIVPAKVVNEEYQERGNPDLQRAVADNFDLRYGWFPGATQQLLAGVFYKTIRNPIEYTFQADATRGQDIYYSPGNFGTAHNYGAEIDYLKYFHHIGVKANYTYTRSRITTPKTSRRINPTTGFLEPIPVTQERPLYGQSAHIGNLSLLYKDTKKGWDAQLAMAYTGPRINTVSQFLDNDLWQKGFIQMDASLEHKFKRNLSVFVKAANLLNTPTRLFIKGTNPENLKINEDLESKGNTLVRNDTYQQSYLLGLRVNL